VNHSSTIAIQAAGAPAGSSGSNSFAEKTDATSRVLVVVNRKARNGATDLEPALEALSAAFGPPSMLDVDDPAELAERLEGACGPEIDRVVVAGGDGTINSTLTVLLRARKPLGILPLGTANDFARTLGIPTNLDAAAAIIVAGQTKRIDVGVVNGRYFLNAAGIGFSAKLQQELPDWAKRRFGPLAYPIGVIRRWRDHRAFSVLIRGGGAPIRRRVIQVTVANGRFYGGGMTAEQDARIDDGQLDIVMVLPGEWWRHISSVVGLKRGVYPDAVPIEAERRGEFELTTLRPEWIATDGERSTQTPATFAVLPGALEVYAP
jgi:YegS/Rv2252/BmrU family lipid kinase